MEKRVEVDAQEIVERSFGCVVIHESHVQPGRDQPITDSIETSRDVRMQGTSVMRRRSGCDM